MEIVRVLWTRKNTEENIKELKNKDLHSLIDRTLHEINKFWQKGLLNWIKLTHPKEWSEILNLEEKINTLVFGGDEKGLSEFLTKYRELFLELSREYSKIKGERR